MPYTPQTWNDNDPTTPVDAARLTHIETGVQTAQTTADTAISDFVGLGSAVPPVSPYGFLGTGASGTNWIEVDGLTDPYIANNAGVQLQKITWASQSAVTGSTLADLTAPVIKADTTNGAFTTNLPPSPTQGTLFFFVDIAGKWNTHGLTIGRNGNLIDGAASNIGPLSTQWGNYALLFVGTSWFTLWHR